MRMIPKQNKLIIICILLLALGACKTLFKTSPYQTYINSLQNNGLLNTKMGKSWVSAGQDALLNPTQQVKTPFKERLYFQDYTPLALGYKINYSKGRKLRFKIATSA